MITAVDTNVISAIWTNEPNASSAESLLTESCARGPLVLCPVVYSELLCHPAVQPADAEKLLVDADVRIDFDLDQAVWREAGIRFRSYLKRRPGRCRSPSFHRGFSDRRSRIAVRRPVYLF